MKILIDAHIFNHSHQGTRTYLKGLYSSLIPIAPHIDFYFAAYDISVLKEEFGELHKNVFFIKYSSENKFYRLLIDLPKIIREYNIDYAHYQYISPLLKTCKEIVTIHDILFNDFPEYFPRSYRVKNNFLFKRSAKRADILLTVSKYSRRQIAKHYKIDAKNIYVTLNGVASCFFDAKDNDKLPDVKTKYSLSKYLLCVSRIEPRKNHITLIKAFVELKLYEKGYDLVLVGKEDLKSNEIHEYLNGLNHKICQKIKFFNNVGKQEQLSFLKGASLFIYPSFAEGFGIPPLEALASEVPTICANKTAMADFIFFKENHFCPDNIEELKTKISKNLNNRATDTFFKKEYVKSHFNWDTIAKSYLKILNNKS